MWLLLPLLPGRVKLSPRVTGTYRLLAASPVATTVLGLGRRWVKSKPDEVVMGSEEEEEAKDGTESTAVPRLEEGGASSISK
jgi:hypothetical protein